MFCQRSREQRWELQRRHVIEGMVQLLTNGLVLQLLSVQFIWGRSEVDRYKDRAGVKGGSSDTNKPGK